MALEDVMSDGCEGEDVFLRGKGFLGIRNIQCAEAKTTSRRVLGVSLVLVAHEGRWAAVVDE